MKVNLIMYLSFTRLFQAPSAGVKLEAGRTADIAVLEYTDEGFSLTDKAGNHIESKNGYRCVLTVSDGLVVYRH